MYKWVSTFILTFHLCHPHVNCLDYEFFSQGQCYHHHSSLSSTLSLTNKKNGLFMWCNQLKVTMTCNDAIIKRRSIFFAKIITVHFFLFSWWVSSAAAYTSILTFKYKPKEKDAKKKDICIFDSECSFSINTWINFLTFLLILQYANLLQWCYGFEENAIDIQQILQNQFLWKNEFHSDGNWYLVRDKEY